MITEKIVSSKINGFPSKLKISWDESYIQMIILEGGNAWTSLVPTDKLPEIAIQLDQDSKSYSRNLHLYLFQSENHENISFAIVDNEFIIHKTIQEGFRVKYFYTKLEKKEYFVCAETIIDELLNTNVFLENQNLNLQKLLDQEIEERTYVSENYEKLKKEILDKEKELYSSFVLLLNEKKKRIQYLTDIISTNNSSNGTLVKSQTKNGDKHNLENKNSNLKVETVSDSEGSSSNNSYVEHDTDEEKERRELPKMNPSDSNKPSTSKDEVFSLFKACTRPVVFPQKKMKFNNEDSVTVPNTIPCIKEDTNKIEENEKRARIKEEESPVEFGTQDILDRM